MQNNFKILLFLAILIGTGVGCKKSYLDTNPTSEISNSSMFETTASAYTALNGIHALMISDKLQTNHAEFGMKAIDLEEDMMGQDMVGSGSNYDHFDFHYKYMMTEPGSAMYWGPYHIWNFFYRIINNANAIINNIDNADGPLSEKNDLKGQALAYRAFAYYKLTTYFCQNIVVNPNVAQGVLNASAPGVPIYTTSTTPETEGAPRGTVADNYELINADINEAVELLSQSVEHSNKAHINYFAAQGLKARINLVQAKYQIAADAALEALNNYPIMSKTEYTSGFNIASNPEWIWASAYSDEQYESLGILSFISFMDQDAPGYAAVGATRSITKALYDTIPPTDIRKEVFLQNLVQNKFRTRNAQGFVFDNVYMRSSEMYLIAAEGLHRVGQESLAKDLLESMVTMRDDNYVAPTGGDALLNEILLQRRIELWGEGFAYSDIRRLHLPLVRKTGTGNHRSGVARILTLPANSPQFIYKIPQREIDANNNLTGADQNP